jgi:hypothetical protein
MTRGGFIFFGQRHCTVKFKTQKPTIQKKFSEADFDSVDFRWILTFSNFCHRALAMAMFAMFQQLHSASSAAPWHIFSILAQQDT